VATVNDLSTVRHTHSQRTGAPCWQAVSTLRSVCTVREYKNRTCRYDSMFHCLDTVLTIHTAKSRIVCFSLYGCLFCWGLICKQNSVRVSFSCYTLEGQPLCGLYFGRISVRILSCLIQSAEVHSTWGCRK